MDIIISMYKDDTKKMLETLNGLSSLPPIQNISEIRTFVYVKDPDANIKELQEALSTPRVFQIPNVGREAGSYLHHIVTNYDDLAKHNMFIQADMHEYEGAKQRILDYFIDNTGVLPLGSMEVCDCTSCKDPWSPDRVYPRIEELYSLLNGKFCPPSVTLSYLGQMITSEKRILMRPREAYKYIKEVLESEQDHFIHTDLHGIAGFEDDPSNPYFGHTMERAWMVIWGCENTGWQCTGWDQLRQKRKGGEADDHCQCLDL